MKILGELFHDYFSLIVQDPLDDNFDYDDINMPWVSFQKFDKKVIYQKPTTYQAVYEEKTLGVTFLDFSFPHLSVNSACGLSAWIDKCFLSCGFLLVIHYVGTAPHYTALHCTTLHHTALN